MTRGNLENTDGPTFDYTIAVQSKGPLPAHPGGFGRTFASRGPAAC